MRVFALALLLFVSTAHAAVLERTPCTVLYTCGSVANDSGLDIEYLTFANDGTVWLNLNGTLYSSGPGHPRASFENVLLSSSAGSVLLSATFEVRRTCTHSGRGQHCTDYVTLTQGSLQ